MTISDIGALSDFVNGGAKQVKLGERTLVVVRIEDDVYVLDDRCSHEDFSLAEGIVDVANCEIECERHGAMFSLKDGGPMSFPATKPVAHYDVAINNGRVELVLS